MTRDHGPMTASMAAPVRFIARVWGWPKWPLRLAKIFRLQLDRGAVRRAVGGVIPGVVVFPQRARVGDALFGDNALQRRQPVPIISFAGVGIAGSLRLLDLIAENCRPLGPLEQPAIV